MKLKADYNGSLERLVETQDRIHDTMDYFVFLQMYESWLKRDLQKKYLNKAGKYQNAIVHTEIKERKSLSVIVRLANGEEEAPNLNEYQESVFINSLAVFRMTGQLKLEL